MKNKYFSTIFHFIRITILCLFLSITTVSFYSNTVQAENVIQTEEMQNSNTTDSQSQGQSLFILIGLVILVVLIVIFAVVASISGAASAIVAEEE